MVFLPALQLKPLIYLFQEYYLLSNSTLSLLSVKSYQKVASSISTLLLVHVLSLSVGNWLPGKVSVGEIPPNESIFSGTQKFFMLKIVAVDISLKCSQKSKLVHISMLIS
jgi:hypothetical protein